MANKILTPFRYPGAKNKLLPTLISYLAPLLNDSDVFADVFVGGGSVLLHVANQFHNLQLVVNDKDYWMYSFWSVVSSENDEELNQLLELIKTRPTVELFDELRKDNSDDKISSAYKAIFFNRTAFSGILDSGPIGGKEQTSKYTIDCRYNIGELTKKIKNCNNLLRGRTTVFNKDFKELDVLRDASVVLYLDPPYYVKGDQIYREYMIDKDHRELFDILDKRQRWVLSYDDCKEIRSIYENKTILDTAARYCINGVKQSWKNKNELIILPKGE